MSSEGEYPYSPARTLARGYLAGLSALKDLLRERTSGNLRDVYERTRDLWREAQEKCEQSKRGNNRDFSHITKIEKHLRANFLKMIWETTARHGNREYRRVQNERKGKIGPMNRLLNMAGAQMRNFAVTRFPFPQPKILVREGRTRVYGYEGDETFPRVQVTHATLPEMDFVDMIRSHVFELCRKCFLNDVPMREASRYVNLLIYRLAPFLEYLYTSGESGHWGFKRERKSGASEERPHADKILREIVREIETLYGTQNGRPRTVTEQIGTGYEPLGVSLFLDESIRLREVESEREQQWGEYLRRLCDRKILRADDAYWLQSEIVKRARWHGTRLHQILTMGLPQPYSVRSMVLEGDKFARVGEDLRMVAELPLKTSLGEGRADLVVFRRHLLGHRKTREQMAVWQPIAVFDIKTKTAFDWWIESERRESKKQGAITIPRFNLKRRVLTEDEWERLVTQTPKKDERIQIDAYAGGLRGEYMQTTGDETVPLPVTGTIVVDVTQESNIIRKGLRRLISTMFGNYTEDLAPRIGEKLVMSLDEYNSSPLRLSLVIHSINHAQKMMLQKQGEPLVKRENKDSLNRESNLMLYCTVPSGSRSGHSAAWIAQYWHGLEYVQNLQNRENVKQVIWIDVSGDFRARRLAECRLRLDEHDSIIAEFFNHVEILNASDMFHSFLFRGKQMPTLRTILRDIRDAEGSSVIVVSGWEQLESRTPGRLRSALHECKRHLVEDLIDYGDTVLWFERARISEETSCIYQRKRVIPFTDNSPFHERVREVIWNLPTRPYATGQTAPVTDNLRIIVEQDSDRVRSHIVEVPVLENWSSRFWNQLYIDEDRDSNNLRGRQPLSKEDILASTTLQDDLLESALDLIMPAQSLAPSEELEDGAPVISVERMPIIIEKQVMVVRTPLLTFHQRQKGVGGKRGFMSSSIATPAITDCRRYRSYMWRNQSVERNYNPPSVTCLVSDGLNINRAYQVERERIYNTLKLLRKVEISDEWNLFLDMVRKTLVKSERQRSTRMISEFLRSHPISAELWEQMSWTKERLLTDGLSKTARMELEEVLTENPQIHLDLGNYLFLFLLCIKYQELTMTREEYETIWSNLRSWQLLQIGFSIDYHNVESIGRTVFDLSKIWSDISKRTNELTQKTKPKTPNIRYGRILVAENEDNGYDYWILVQKRFRSPEMVAGMWQNVNPMDASDKFRWSINSHDVLAASAKRARDALEYDDIAVIDTYDEAILWIWSGDAWDRIGRIEIIQQGGKESKLIRGIRVQQSLKSEQIESSFPVRKKVDISKLVTSSLVRLQESSSSYIPVECKLGIDNENYVVTLHASNIDEQDVVETLVFERTQELVDFLRLPLVTGDPVAVDGDNDCQYIWNPYTDIHYGNVRIVRPFVERKKPFTSTRVTLPKTAKEFIRSTTISVKFKITHDVYQCPICLGNSHDHAACWVLENKTGEVSEKFSSIIEVGLTDTEIYELAKSRVVYFDGVQYEIDIEFPDDEKYDERLIFRESQFFAWYLEARRILPSSFLEMKNERLQCDVFRDGEFIVIYVKSDITGDLLYSGPLIQLSKKMNIKEMNDQAQDTLNTITENRYGEKCVKTKVKDYDILLTQISNVIKNGA